MDKRRIALANEVRHAWRNRLTIWDVIIEWIGILVFIWFFGKILFGGAK